MTLLKRQPSHDIGIDKRILSDGQDIPIHNELGFKGMRAAGRLASQTLDYITPFVAEGVSTEKLDQLCHDFILKHNAIPAPLNYRGFPKSICTSVNHVVCHGIPSPTKILKTGDIINIDVTVILDGWFGDTSRMFKIGKTSNLASKLIDVTYDSLMKAIDLVKPGATLGDIGHVIQDYAESQGFSIVREFCGHGLGRVFHDAPEVVHFGTPDTGVILEEGMFFTIEPMVNAGKAATKTLGDGWTAVTRDKTLSAQFEHSLGVTATGVEIFTKSA
ncbi:MAG: type I methionyl aminopeptidase [Alphaproteobacteria bacterium]|nr:type I methionyl aminopeptidase [Alphaproteobacteria bacterium]NCQ66944.1 type I methionyl aminopeptidase [Alphaproteobacteria bacterium]NCT07511.1 type I methionyl aminopeptidase [Alphaproteobacteria bacterium]